jgi:hypothetical protein
MRRLEPRERRAKLVTLRPSHAVLRSDADSAISAPGTVLASVRCLVTGLYGACPEKSSSSVK